MVAFPVSSSCITTGDLQLKFSGGAEGFLISIVVVQELVFPVPSVAVKVIFFVPGVVKVVWERLKAKEQLSLEPALISAVVMVTKPLTKVNSLPGAMQLVIGSILSAIVTEALQTAELPLV
jgi:hypothetical protein